jgi:hypothetical protein
MGIFQNSPFRPRSFAPILCRRFIEIAGPSPRFQVCRDLGLSCRSVERSPLQFGFGSGPLVSRGAFRGAPFFQRAGADASIWSPPAFTCLAGRPAWDQRRGASQLQSAARTGQADRPPQTSRVQKFHGCGHVRCSSRSTVQDRVARKRLTPARGLRSIRLSPRPAKHPQGHHGPWRKARTGRSCPCIGRRPQAVRTWTRASE